MSEFIRLRANGADAYPDASTENTYRPNGTSVESALVNLESNVTTLGGVAGDAKTLAEQNSVKIATAEQEISDINSSLTLDFSNASVSDLNTFLQSALDKLFPKTLYILKNGVYEDGYSAKVVSTSTLTQGSDYIEFHLKDTANNDSDELFFMPSFDFSGYSKLNFTISATSDRSEPIDACYVGYAETDTFGKDNFANYVALPFFGSGYPITKRTVSVNIENGGLNYVKIRVGGDSTKNTKVRLYDVWLI